MKLRRVHAALFALAAPLALAAWTAFHIELDRSYPEADASLTEAPAEILLDFSVAPDMERTSFSVRGPDGGVALGDIAAGETADVLRAPVEGAMPAGEYTVSWVAAPVDDHPVRGRFRFSIGAR